MKTARGKMKTHNTTMIDGKLIFMIFFKPSVGCQQGVRGDWGESELSDPPT